MVVTDIRKLVLLLVTLALAAGAGPAVGEQTDSPEAGNPTLSFGSAGRDADGLHPAALTIRDLGGEVMTALADPALDPDQKGRHFRNLLARALDVPVVARLALGRRWNEASPEQRQAYLASFRDYMLNRYANLLGGSAPINGFEIEDTRGLGPDEAMVQTLIQRTPAKPVRVAWRMHRGAEGFRIVDLMVEGVSFLVAQRKEFDAILRSGGDLDGLIALLRERSV